ncbi:MAG: LysR family transcriptional regulator [Bilophila wadsworthia]
MNVSFEYYKVFYHVARLGSITLAAKALFLSQPAVSKCIRQLEKVLGCALFYRMHKGMRLTPEGEVLYQHVAQACEQIAIGEKKIQAMLHLDWGSIHIGSSDMIMHAFLLPYLERFHKDYPKVRISTITASTPETIASLRARRIDLGVVFSPVEENEDLDIIPVCRVRIRLSRVTHFAIWKAPCSRWMRLPSSYRVPGGTSTGRIWMRFPVARRCA